MANWWQSAKTERVNGVNIRISNIEIINKFKFRIFQCSKLGFVMRIVVFRLDHLNFGASDLFRISCFGFRIFNLKKQSRWVSNANRLVFKLRVIARRFPSICGSLSAVQVAQVRQIRTLVIITILSLRFLKSLRQKIPGRYSHGKDLAPVL